MARCNPLTLSFYMIIKTDLILARSWNQLDMFQPFTLYKIQVVLVSEKVGPKRFQKIKRLELEKRKNKRLEETVVALNAACQHLIWFISIHQVHPIRFPSDSSWFSSHPLTLHLTSSHLTSSHLISSNPIRPHLISSHLIYLVSSDVSHLITFHFMSFHFLSCSFILSYFISYPFLSFPLLSFPFSFFLFPFSFFLFPFLFFIIFHFISYPFISSHFISFHFMFHVALFHYFMSNLVWSDFNELLISSDLRPFWLQAVQLLSFDAMGGHEAEKAQSILVPKFSSCSTQEVAYWGPGRVATLRAGREPALTKMNGEPATLRRQMEGESKVTVPSQLAFRQILRSTVERPTVRAAPDIGQLLQHSTSKASFTIWQNLEFLALAKRSKRHSVQEPITSVISCRLILRILISSFSSQLILRILLWPFSSHLILLISAHQSNSIQYMFNACNTEVELIKLPLIKTYCQLCLYRLGRFFVSTTFLKVGWHRKPRH